jgi:hypothetical protein
MEKSHDCINPREKVPVLASKKILFMSIQGTVSNKTICDKKKRYQKAPKIRVGAGARAIAVIRIYGSVERSRKMPILRLQTKGTGTK